MVLSAYRRDDYADPVGFVTQLGVVLETYPRWIVQYVTDPKTGIQRKSTFPPSLAEVVKACEELYAPTRYAREWDARAQTQPAERAALPAPKARAPRGRIVTYREVEEIEQSKKVHVFGAFDHDRQATYRG